MLSGLQPPGNRLRMTDVGTGSVPFLPWDTRCFVVIHVVMGLASAVAISLASGNIGLKLAPQGWAAA